jgi:molecular chaperone DnaJ
VYLKKGEDGHVVIRFNVETDQTVRREGLNIISKHYITLTEALLGCSLVINTVQGAQTIEFKQGVPNSGFRYTLSNKGIGGQGDHIAEIDIVMP